MSALPLSLPAPALSCAHPPPASFMTHCLQLLTLKYSTVVAVVGRGHVAGIVSNWGRDDIDVSCVPIPPCLLCPDHGEKVLLFGMAGASTSVSSTPSPASLLPACEAHPAGVHCCPLHCVCSSSEGSQSAVRQSALTCTLLHAVLQQSNSS